MDITTAIQSVATAIGLAKELREIDRGIDEAGYKLKLADLTEGLADAKISLTESQSLIHEKDQEIERLKDSFKLQQAALSKRGFRYVDRGDGTPQGNPFCPRCETKDGFMILLTKKQRGGISDLQCPECKSDFHAGTYTYPDEG